MEGIVPPSRWEIQRADEREEKKEPAAEAGVKGGVSKRVGEPPGGALRPGALHAGTVAARRRQSEI